MATQSSVDNSDRSIGELVAAIRTDVSDLVQDQIELAKAELRSEAKSAAMGLGAIAVAASLALFAIVLLSFALVIVVNNTGITLGWSFTIVAGAYLLLAAGLVVSAKLGFSKVVGPRRTRASVANTAKALRPSAHHE